MKRYLYDLDEQTYRLKCGVNLIDAVYTAMVEGPYTEGSFTDAFFAAYLYTFALNCINHTFNCKRGSCDRHGHFSELCRDAGVEMDEDVFRAPPVHRTYKRPESKPEPPTDQVAGYLHRRGLRDSTIEVFGVGAHKGNIMFPFYRNTEDFEAKSPTFVKFREPRRINKGKRKMWREADTEPILFGMHLCDPNHPALYLFEGEFDCMCGWQATGFNCVSVPSGCEDFSWLDTCSEWLERFETIGIFADNDTAGKKMLEELGRKLNCRVLRPNFDLYLGCKDCNEVLFKQGPEAVKTILETMRPLEVKGLLNLAEVRTVDLSGLPRSMTGIGGIDKATGGMLYGDLTVWTGKRGEGKSTLLTQILLEAADQGENVCIYSGEIPADRLKYGINLQAAGPDAVQSRLDTRTGRTMSFVPHGPLEKIQEWYNGKIWVYDNRAAETDETEAILKIFELAYRRYDCRVFLVDNLMTVNTTARERDVLQMQADFAVKLRKLADRLNVHIHLVVHPRKTDGTIRDSDSVGGLGTITNIACNVFSVHRCSPKEKDELGCDTIVSCLKNRAYGECVDVRMNFEDRSRRFFEAGAVPKIYGWKEQRVFETERFNPDEFEEITF